MKLELDQKEIEKILLEWATAKWPETFNTVEWGGYRGPSTATLEWVEDTDAGRSQA